MRTQNRLSRLAGLLVMVALVGIGSADVQFSVNGGLSWPFDAGADDFNTGFVVGGHGFLAVTPNLLIGARAAYNRWGIDEFEVSQDFPDVINPDVDGATHVIELLPAARLMSDLYDWPFNIFAHAAVGVYIRTQHASLEGQSADGVDVDIDLFDETDGRLGLQAGGGISLGRVDGLTVELYPLYNLIFSGKNLSQYMTANVGIVLRLP